eukprot:scaffold189_cov118-Isochrysis_galbana.AAC.15
MPWRGVYVWDLKRSAGLELVQVGSDGRTSDMKYKSGDSCIDQRSRGIAAAGMCISASEADCTWRRKTWTYRHGPCCIACGAGWSMRGSIIPLLCGASLYAPHPRPSYSGM